MDDYIERILAAYDDDTCAEVNRIIDLFLRGMITDLEKSSCIHHAIMEGRKHDHGIH